MRILHVYKDFAPVVGGIENHILRLARGQLKYPGVKVRVLATERGKQRTETTVDGIRVTKVGRFATVASTPLSWDLVQEIGRRRYDIIHLHFPYPVGEIAYLLNGHSTKMVISYHSDVVRQKTLLLLYRPFLEMVLNRADAIIASTPPYVKRSPYLRRFSKKTVVIPYGLEMERFIETPAIRKRADEIRRALGEPLTLFVGELRYYKGVDVLIRAMRDAPGRLAIVGLGPEEDRLRSLVDSEGLQHKVTFRGRVPDDELVAHYHAADLFVLPSVLPAEAFGIVLLEAMAARLPLVTTELGTGTSWVNRHGETGLVVPPNDVPALAAAIRSLLANPAQRQTMGHAAYLRLIDDFTIDIMVEHTMALYERLLTPRSKR